MSLAPASHWRSLGIAGAIGLLALAGCSHAPFVVGVVRYKLSMTFQVDDRQLTASVVQEVGFDDVPDWTLAQQRHNSYVRGSALVVDLGALGSLTVLPYSGYLLPQSCGVVSGTRETTSQWVERLRASFKSCDLKEAQFIGYPHFLRGLPVGQQLPSVELSKSYTITAPQGFLELKKDEISKVFGGRVQLLRAWFEATDEPLSVGTPLKWAQPIVAGTVPFIDVPSTGRGAYRVARSNFEMEDFNDY